MQTNEYYDQRPSDLLGVTMVGATAGTFADHLKPCECLACFGSDRRFVLVAGTQPVGGEHQ